MLLWAVKSSRPKSCGGESTFNLKPLSSAAKSVIYFETSSSSIKRCNIKRWKRSLEPGSVIISFLTPVLITADEQIFKGRKKPNRLLGFLSMFCFWLLPVSHMHVWMHRSLTVLGVRVDEEWARRTRPKVPAGTVWDQQGDLGLNPLCAVTMCTLTFPLLLESAFPSSLCAPLMMRMMGMGQPGGRPETKKRRGGRHL